MPVEIGIPITQTKIELSSLSEKNLTLEAMPYGSSVRLSIGYESATVDAVALAAALRAMMPGLPILISEPRKR